MTFLCSPQETGQPYISEQGICKRCPAPRDGGGQLRQSRIQSSRPDFRNDVLRSSMSPQRRAEYAISASCGALMPGYAFSIEDALLASRWAEQILPLGYRVVITPNYENAEEVIEVFIPNATPPAFRVHRTTNSVLVTDCIGLSLSFSTLVDALLVMVPLPRSARREMLKGGSPAWFPAVLARPASEPGSMCSRVSRLASSVIPASIKRHREPPH